MNIFNLDMIISIGYRVNSKRGGNKRIAAFLFLWFLEENGVLYKKDGSRRLSENALVALTLLIAESQPKDRETILKVIVNLINMRN